jgi:hypothetical protein
MIFFETQRPGSPRRDRAVRVSGDLEMRENAQPSSATYLWCNQCRRSFRHEEAGDDLGCPICGTAMEPTGKMNAILRGLMANELATSDVTTKHRQIVRLIWTRHGQGEQYYRLLDPGIPYNRFEARVTDLICRGASEGWINIVMPAAPSTDERHYRIEFVDEDRFLQELSALAVSTTKGKQRANP